MKLVVFGDQRRLGALVSGHALDLAAADSSEPAFRSLQALIESGQCGLDAVSELTEKYAGSDAPQIWHALDQIELQAPWPGQRFLLAGSNHAKHIAEAFTHLGDPLSVEEAHARGRAAVPSSFWSLSRPMGPGADIRIPTRANGYFDYEGEPAIILGKQGKDIKADDIADYVWGVTLVADWSIRLPEWPPRPNPPFMPVKNFDNSKSIGPCIVVGEIDPQNFDVETVVNGVLKQKFSSSEMIYSFGEILEFFSRDFTFYPGDVIAGGTGSGTVVDQIKINPDGSWPKDVFLKPGDIVEIRSDAIGTLVSHIVD